MSIVRYTNKKTGVVSIYESTSYYDPVKKQSRPKRKYLGTEDPVTGELIPSSGIRGRRKKDGSSPSPRQPKKTDEADGKWKAECERWKKECARKEETIKHLVHENRRLVAFVQKFSDAAGAVIKNASI